MRVLLDANLPRFLVTKRLLRDAGTTGQITAKSGTWMAESVKQSFIAEVAKLELRDQEKNPHSVEDDHGDPEALLAELDAAERETASLREQLKAVLAEALLR